MNSVAGRLVTEAIQIDSDIDLGIAPDLDEISTRVYSVVRTLRNEKARHAEQKQQEQQQNQHPQDHGRPAIHNRSR